jgi:hypothetical protein
VSSRRRFDPAAAGLRRSTLCLLMSILGAFARLESLGGLGRPEATD